MKQRFKFFIILLIIMQSQVLYQQTVEILWEHGLGGNFDDRAYDIIETQDGGFLSVGYTNSIDGDIELIHGNTDLWIVKTNAFGEMEWQKTYGGTGYENCYSVCLGVDGGYLLAGTSDSDDGDVSSNFGGDDVWIVKIDETGNIEWEKSYGGSHSDVPECVIQTVDGNYVFAVASVSNDGDISGHHGGADQADYWIVKIDNIGNILWENSYGSTFEDIPYEIIETSNHNFVITGSTSGYNGDVTENWGESDYWIIKITQEGELLWQKSLGGSNTEHSFSIIEMMNGNFICGGESLSDDGLITDSHGWIDNWIVCIDSTADLIWQKSYGSFDAERSYSLVKQSENEIVFVGTSTAIGDDVTENKGANDYWIGSIDTLGNFNWQTSIGGSSEDIASSIINTLDGYFAIAGMSYSTDFDVTESYTGYNFWIVKLGYCNTQYFADNDGDGFGNILNDTISCYPPIGYVADITDCDDTNNLIYPSAEEICNNLDDDCDGDIDDNLIYVYFYQDADGDDFGNAEIDSLACTIPFGYVEDDTDCDDTNPNIYPGAIEILNGLDDDCDGFTDEGLAINEIILNSIHIYPNPTEDILHLEYKSSDDAEIEIINITGQILFSFKLNSSQTDINMTNYSAGVYMLKIHTIQGNASLPFVKE